MPKLPDDLSLGERPRPNPSPGGQFLASVSNPEPQAEEQLGQAVYAIGDEMAKAHARVQSRADTIERTRAVGAYKELATGELLKRSTEDDFSKPSAMVDYGKFLSTRRDELLKSHPGTPDSRMLLFQQLERERYGMSAQAANISTQSQIKLLESTLDNKLNVTANRAYEAPDSLPERFLDLDRDLADMAPALTPDQEIKFRNTGRAQIAKMAIESFVDRGAFDEAERILGTPGVVDVLGEESQRSVRKHIAEQKYAIRRERMKILGEASAKREGLRIILGREPTDQELALSAGVLPKTDKSDQLFGTGITGRALSIMTEYAPAYAQGLLTADQERIFQAAVTQYQQPQMYFDPNTGQATYRKPVLPPFVDEALRRSPVTRKEWITVPGGEPMSAAENAALARVRAAAETGHGLTLEVDPKTGVTRQINPPTAGEGAAPASAAPSGQTVWGLSDLTTGPVPAIAEHASRIPGIGELIPAPQFTQARNFVPLLQRDLVRVLQNNPRYAEGERKAIEAEIKIEPQIWDTPTAARNRLIAIDDALELREQQATKTATTATVGREERIQAMNVLNALVNFRKNLGVPPLVRSPAEARKLPSGTQFRDPQGNVRTVP